MYMIENNSTSSHAHPAYCNPANRASNYSSELIKFILLICSYLNCSYLYFNRCMMIWWYFPLIWLSHPHTPSTSCSERSKGLLMLDVDHHISNEGSIKLKYRFSHGYKQLLRQFISLSKTYRLNIGQRGSIEIHIIMTWWWSANMESSLT